MSATMAILRLARRDARRNRAASLLVVALIAIPVAALVGGVTIFRTTEPAPDDIATSLMGRADLLISDVRDGEARTGAAIDELSALLPTGSVIEPLVHAQTSIDHEGRRLSVAVVGADLDGLAGPIFATVSGVSPTGTGQVAMSTALLDDIDAQVGDGVTLEVLGEVTVVGEIVEREHISSSTILAPADVVAAVSGSEQFSLWLTKLPAGFTEKDLPPEISNGEPAPGVSFLVQNRQRRGGQNRANAVLVLGGFAFVEAALIVAAAFAVSVRRRQRELGLLAATGAHNGHLHRTVVASGLVLGTVGSVLGTLLGIAGVLAVYPRLQEWSGRLIDGIELSTWRIAVVIAAGILTATLAAAVPARTTSRLPVLVALAGRRPSPRPSRRAATVGILLCLIGFATVAVTAGFATGGGEMSSTAQDLIPIGILSGAVLGVLGFGALSPWVLEKLGLMAPRLPVALRLAVRDTGRFRSRNGPVVTAVLAGLAASIALATGLSSLNERERSLYLPQLREDQIFVSGDHDGAATSVASAVESVGTEVAANAPIVYAASQDGEAMATTLQPLTPSDAGIFLTTAVGSPHLARALTDDERVPTALEEGKAVLFGEASAAFDEVGVFTDASLEPELVLEVFHADGVGLASRTPTALLPPTVVTELGLETASSPEVVIRLSQPVTDAQAAAAAAAADRSGIAVQVERGYVDRTAGLRRWALVGALATGLIVIAIALALSAAETRGDQRTLVAVGANPSVRRRINTGRAAVLGLLGGLLAVPAGLLPVWGLVNTIPTMSLVVPWDAVLTAAVGLPSLAVLGAWLGSTGQPGWLAYRRRPT